MIERETYTPDLLPFEWLSSSTESSVAYDQEAEITDDASLTRFFEDLFRDSQGSNETWLCKDSTVNDRSDDRPPSDYYNHLSTRFVAMLYNEEFEFGVISHSESIVEEELTKNPLETRNWLNELFVSYFSEAKVLIGILHIISRFREFEMHPQGLTMALAALSHKDDEVKELGARAFEHWASRTSLEVLKNVHVGTPWLQNYINQVVEDLSLEHGIPCPEVHAK